MISFKHLSSWQLGQVSKNPNNENEISKGQLFNATAPTLSPYGLNLTQCFTACLSSIWFYLLNIKPLTHGVTLTVQGFCCSCLTEILSESPGTKLDNHILYCGDRWGCTACLLTMMSNNLFGAFWCSCMYLEDVVHWCMCHFLRLVIGISGCLHFKINGLVLDSTHLAKFDIDLNFYLHTLVCQWDLC